MNLYKIPLVILVLSFSVSCSNRTEKKRGPSPVKEENQLNQTDFDLQESEIEVNDDLFAAYEMHWFENKLIFNFGIPNPNYFKVFDLESQKILGAFGKEGSGPGEFVGAVRTSIENFGKLGVFSRSTGNKYYEIYIDSALNFNSYEIKPLVSLIESGTNRVVRNSTGFFFAITLHEPKRLSVYDENGQFIDSFFDYPFQSEIKNIPEELYGMIYQSKIVKSNQKNRVAIFNMDGPNWDIIEMNDNKPILVNQTHLRQIEFRDESDISGEDKSYSAAVHIENKKGFIDVKANDDFIFGLYSGKSYKRFGYEAGLGDIVIVLDWNGNLIGRYKLKTMANKIAVDEENKYIYSLVEYNQSNKLFKNRLPKIID